MIKQHCGNGSTFASEKETIIVSKSDKEIKHLRQKISKKKGEKMKMMHNCDVSGRRNVRPDRKDRIATKLFLLQYRGGDNRHRHIGNNIDEVSLFNIMFNLNK